MTQQPTPVVGTIQNYAWGDTEFIPALLGEEPTGDPCAELWFGTHPGGPATFTDGTALESVTGALPYLLKVLSAAEPLSLQVHPSAAQAAAGFAEGVFDDPFAKPELLVALTPFDALCGLRPSGGTIDLLRTLGLAEIADAVRDGGPGLALRALFRGHLDPLDAVRACADSTRPECVLVTTLHAKYGADPGVAVTLLLNRVHLEPGEALHLTAGNLHTYLHGSGVELMQASDNVVRGGLTDKLVDVDLLLDIVDPTPLPDPVIVPRDGRYPLPEAGVELVVLECGQSHVATGHELAISLAGESYYLAAGTEYTATARSFVVTAL